MATVVNKSRSDIVSEVAEGLGETQAKVDLIVRAYEDAVTASLAKGGEVRLAGFGSFKVSKRAARTARNPQTGDPIKVAARKVARFQPAKALKDAVDGAKPAAKPAAKKPAAKKKK
jgi:DNA-binding protein HU-beta